MRGGDLRGGGVVEPDLGPPGFARPQPATTPRRRAARQRGPKHRVDAWLATCSPYWGVRSSLPRSSQPKSGLREFVVVDREAQNFIECCEETLLCSSVIRQVVEV